ncbi:MAG: hypothetical protein IJT24_00525 [Lachnospiraceae bacterium]|nr:hypothetical protein [Lachnospiraceae bacterium]
MDGLSAEQQALLASIMGNSSQARALNPTITPAAAPAPAAAPTPAPAATPAPAPAMPAAGGNENRVLSQAEIDALFAAMT